MNLFKLLKSREPSLEKAQKNLYTLKEEIVNSVTHRVGAVLSVGVLAVLFGIACWQNDPWRIAGFSVFGVSLFLVYLTSSMYHGITKPRIKQIFRILDHTAIYLLIAGTYTPVILVYMRNPIGWTLFGVVWLMAAAGIIHELFFFGKLNKMTVPYYALMGGLLFFALKPILLSVPEGMLTWLLVGAAAYLVGLIFYAWEKLPYNHAVWHMGVLIGSMTHVIGIFTYMT